MPSINFQNPSVSTQSTGQKVFYKEASFWVAIACASVNGIAVYKASTPWVQMVGAVCACLIGLGYSVNASKE